GAHPDLLIRRRERSHIHVLAHTCSNGCPPWLEDLFNRVWTWGKAGEVHQPVVVGNTYLQHDTRATETRVQFHRPTGQWLVVGVPDLLDGDRPRLRREGRGNGEHWMVAEDEETLVRSQRYMLHA